MAIEQVEDAPLICTRARGGGTVVFEATALRVGRLLRIRAAIGGGPCTPLEDFLKETPGLAELGAPGCIVELRSSAADETILATRTRPGEVVVVSLRTYRSPTPYAPAAILGYCIASTAASPLMAAIEDTDGMAALRLTGRQVTSVLCRLADVSSLPKREGCATQLRLADLHATLIRRRDEHIVMIGAPYRDFLLEWLRYAAAGENGDMDVNSMNRSTPL